MTTATVIHRQECPANPNYLSRSRPGTLCLCPELEKAEKDSQWESEQEDSLSIKRG